MRRIGLGDTNKNNLDMAGWQSGHAADCNSVNAGSIPTPASISKSPNCAQVVKLVDAVHGCTSVAEDRRSESDHKIL